MVRGLLVVHRRVTLVKPGVTSTLATFPEADVNKSRVKPLMLFISSQLSVLENRFMYNYTIYSTLLKPTKVKSTTETPVQTDCFNKTASSKSESITCSLKNTAQFVSGRHFPLYLFLKALLGTGLAHYLRTLVF